MSLAADVKTKRDERRLRTLRKRFLGFVTICWFISITCAVFEVFALLNIQFCDGEDLITLYWSFWGFLQVGSILAIFGVILNLWIALANVHTPAWAVALGTPVLVFAALYWILHNVWKGTWKEFTGKCAHGEDEEGDEEEEEDVEKGGDGKRQLDAKERDSINRWTSTA